ncbi:hypothetical protein [Leadbettera azotonutricia]|uniref:hypothetical protein n=1 Tax=Leadbettera azotonutricia TaxID=150829 RepID=UPI0002D6736F|nr:hypothetical protein [Leadbettera azotonutricia]
MKLMMNNAPREATVCKVALAAALVAMLLFAACSNPAGSREGKYAAVDDFDLSGLSITAPAQGVAVSSLPAISGDQYTGAGEWVKESGAAYVGATFDGGTVYKAKYVLHTKGDFTFTGITGPFTFGGLTVEIAANTGSTLTILIIFPATTGTASDPDSDGSGSGGDGSTTEGSLINAINLAPNIATPVLGGTPTTAFSEERYEASAILWTPSVGSVFAASTSYQAEVTLIAKGTYTFKNPIAITHGSASAAPITVSYTNSTAIKVTLKFPPTGSTSATSFNLGPYNYPKVGSTPTELGLAGVDASSPEYTVAKSLSLTSGGDAVTSIESDKTFYLTLTLTAKPGFNFNGVTASSISATFKNFTDVSKAFTISAANFSNTGSVITVTLSHAEFISEKKVNDFDLKTVYTPLSGTVPGDQLLLVPNWNNSQYSAVRTYSPLISGKIQNNVQFNLTYTLTAQTDYTFTGVSPASFVLKCLRGREFTFNPGSGTVSNGGNTLTVTFSDARYKSQSRVALDLTYAFPKPATGKKILEYCSKDNGWVSDGGVQKVFGEFDIARDDFYKKNGTNWEKMAISEILASGGTYRVHLRIIGAPFGEKTVYNGNDTPINFTHSGGITFSGYSFRQSTDDVAVVEMDAQFSL